MTRRRPLPSPEIGTAFEAGTTCVYAGTTRLGTIIPRGRRLECFTASGEYLASFGEKERRAAVEAVHRAAQREGAPS
ncbi:hypothetical protein ACTZWW_03085 [Salinarimonas sp. NSM]|uniref:hypothetical protein n=1 Tax=Salinarimonas sp. NSM TaxID=3458003 RepID=UPI0040354279